MLLVDDHAIVREGIKRLLEPIASQWVISEASTAHEALDCLRNGSFDLAVVDMSMPGMNGLDLTERIKAVFGTVKVLMLSMHAEEQYALRAFKAGASGYVAKQSVSAELLAAVRKVSGGGVYVTPGLGERLVRQLNGTTQALPLDRLSNRELEVLQRIVAGETVSAIGAALHLSVKTVSTHKTRILDKLNQSSTAALIRFGLEHGLGTEPPC
jgi:DNA-binding NarL/FixJ family response regulator